MMRSSLLYPVAAALVLGAAPPAQGVVNETLLRAPADDAAAAAVRDTPVAAAVGKARAAVVHVGVEVDGPRGKFPIVRSSSGAIVDASGLVLTWWHLAAEAAGATDKHLFVQLDDAERTRLPAQILRRDEDTGLVLLRIAPPAAGLPHLELGTDLVQPGEPVAVLACPEGKDLLGFAGVATPALADVALAGRAVSANDVFLTDSKQDQRCDGGAVIDATGRLVGLYHAEHVQRDRSEPTLDDLRRPSFGLVRPASAIRRAFVAEFTGAANATLRVAPAAGPAAEALAVRRIAPSVVGVFGGDGDWPVLGTADPGAVQRRPGSGSGVVLGRRGLVVTNAHLCAGAAAQVRIADGRTFPAKVLQRQGASNLALLRVELPAGVELVAAPCNPDDDARIGETVLAVGSPLGRRPTVTAGVVSARRSGGRIQADPNLGNQNAGGAVVDVTGRLLGIGDGGAVDPLEMAFAMRGDRVSTETNLSTFVGIAHVRRVFGKQLEEFAAPDESVRAPSAPTEAEIVARTRPLVRMVEKAGGAMLNIYVARNVAKVDPDDPFAEMAPKELVPTSVGSGVIIDPTGLAISNWHVVDDATNPDGSMVGDHAVTASVFGGKTYPVRVLSISREDDLSLLQLELPPGETVPAVELGSSDALRIGENVAAIGNPHNRANTVTFGVVVAKDQKLKVRGRWADLEHLVETDAAINGGNSGGALLDLNGRLVGINSAGGGTFTNRGYAIAVDHVRKQLLSLLLQPYKLRSPDLGMRVLDDEGEVVVMDVDERGPAAAAGVRSGDRIASLGGVPITWSPGFALQLAKAEPGVPIELAVRRKGEAKTFTMLPLASEVWAVIRQSGLQCRNFGYREDPDRARQAVVALHRRITGDATGEPAVIPEQFVLVERVFAADPGKAETIQKGDLLLALELQHVATGDPVFVHLRDLVQVRSLWNDRNLGTYEGSDWKCWLARGTEIRTVEITCKRLFW